MKRVVLWALLFAVPGLADGPHIALHDSQGGYTATLFTAPDPLVVGRVEFLLLVTRGEDGPAVPVRKADLVLELDGRPVAVSLRQGDDGVKGAVELTRPGRYALMVLIDAGQSDAVRLSGSLPVAENHGRRDAVLWSVLFPLLAILLFLLNQAAKQKLRGLRAA